MSAPANPALLGFARAQPPPSLADRAAWLEHGGTQVHLMHVEEPVVLDEVEVLLDLLAGRAGVVARRGLVLVHRPEEPEVAGGEEPLTLFLGRWRGHTGDGQLQMRRA